MKKGLSTQTDARTLMLSLKVWKTFGIQERKRARGAVISDSSEAKFHKFFVAHVMVRTEIKISICKCRFAVDINSKLPVVS